MKPDLTLDLSRDTVFIDGVQYTYPKFTKGRVNRAGVLLAKTPNWNQLEIFYDIEDARMVVNNWRSAHSYPLNSINMTLKQRAKGVESSAIVYQRLKRAEAISAKMLRQEKEHGRMFDLTSMQDLGGCRAIMSDVDRIEELLKVYEDAHKKNPDRGSLREKMDDYITRPKPDGYRGIHLIYKYRSQVEEREADAPKDWDRSKFNGLRVEIQIRSQLQHQWASAVETAGRHTRMNIKGDGGGAKWDRFFGLTSSAIAMIENRPPVPDTPSEKKDLVSAIKKHRDLLNLLKKYAAPDVSGVKVKHGEMFVLAVDPISNTLVVKPFQRRHLQDAQDNYFSMEKAIQSKDNVDAVLVGVDSQELLPIAYPSYYLDARDFVRTIEAFIA